MSYALVSLADSRALRIDLWIVLIRSCERCLDLLGCRGPTVGHSEDGTHCANGAFPPVLFYLYGLVGGSNGPVRKRGGCKGHTTRAIRRAACAAQHPELDLERRGQHDAAPIQERYPISVDDLDKALTQAAKIRDSGPPAPRPIKAPVLSRAVNSLKFPSDPAGGKHIRTSADRCTMGFSVPQTACPAVRPPRQPAKLDSRFGP